MQWRRGRRRGSCIGHRVKVPPSPDEGGLGLAAVQAGGLGEEGPLPGIAILGGAACPSTESVPSLPTGLGRAVRLSS